MGMHLDVKAELMDRGLYDEAVTLAHRTADEAFAAASPEVAAAFGTAGLSREVFEDRVLAIIPAAVLWRARATDLAELRRECEAEGQMPEYRRWRDIFDNLRTETLMDVAKLAREVRTRSGEAFAAPQGVLTRRVIEVMQWPEGS
jgi:hypothetical protein